jgi:hypothetical protein
VSRPAARALLLLLGAGLLASCAGKPPDILRVLWQVTGSWTPAIPP